MKNKTAIFVDFENLRQNVFEKARKQKKHFFNYNTNPKLVVEFCKSIIEPDETIYRIFFYTARPSSTHPKYKTINTFLDELEILDHVALRQGKLVKRGETYVQKQVDMLLGLDIADVSINRLVDKIVLIGYDSDMAPALKLARTNGVQSELVKYTDISSQVERTLQKHCDRTRERQVEDIYRKLGIISRPFHANIP
jgi:uncharacterized LabA/DUF88 family protein